MIECDKTLKSRKVLLQQNSSIALDNNATHRFTSRRKCRWCSDFCICLWLVTYQREIENCRCYHIDNFPFFPYHWQDARFDLIIVNAMRFHCKPSNRLKFGLDLDIESMNGVAHPGLFLTGMPTQRGVPTYYLAKCLQKMHGNERILTVRDFLAPSWIRHWNE